MLSKGSSQRLIIAGFLLVADDSLSDRLQLQSTRRKEECVHTTLQALRVVRHSALQFCGYSCDTLFTGYEPKDKFKDSKIGEKRPTPADTRGRNSLTKMRRALLSWNFLHPTFFQDIINSFVSAGNANGICQGVIPCRRFVSTCWFRKYYSENRISGIDRIKILRISETGPGSRLSGCTGFF